MVGSEEQEKHNFGTQRGLSMNEVLQQDKIRELGTCDTGWWGKEGRMGKENN